ncbi:MAG: cation:proton antiporter [Gammaproteobacteria bacterium]
MEVMAHDTIVFTIFLIFTGAAVLSTIVLYTRQSLLVAYIFLGLILGPWGLKLVVDPSLVNQIGNIGIIFLLFLLGLHLQPQNLLHLLHKTSWITLISSLVFACVSGTISYAFGFSIVESAIIGAAMMFSSTIIGLKLLPTTILHHQHIGELMISVLLMQDLLAIVVLLLLQGASNGQLSGSDIARVVIGLPALLAFAFLVEKYVLMKLLMRFDRTQEYIFLLSVGWCLGMTQLSHWFGLSAEIGAFIGGIALAANPIALYIAESLKPLRDFFLVMFFFSIGAAFNLSALPAVFVPAIILSVTLMLLKPFVYSVLCKRIGETKKVANEVGIRLGQASEFSLLVGTLAASNLLLGEKANLFIQATTILTFIMSSYWVVVSYPTPIALTDQMRRD